MSIKNPKRVQVILSGRDYYRFHKKLFRKKRKASKMLRDFVLAWTKDEIEF